MFWALASFSFNNWFFVVFMYNHSLLLFIYDILLCFFCNVYIFFSNYFLLFVMLNYWLMNFIYLCPVYNWLNNFMINWNVMFMYNVFMSLYYNFFVVFMNYILCINFSDLGLLYFLNYGYNFVFVLIIL